MKVDRAGSQLCSRRRRHGVISYVHRLDILAHDRLRRERFEQRSHTLVEDLEGGEGEVSWDHGDVVII